MEAEIVWAGISGVSAVAAGCYGSSTLEPYGTSALGGMSLLSGVVSALFWVN